MRLTLRTMLAYMDGILEPEDAQEIGKKIEESEFAKSLMHRARDVVRRLRLAAPGLTDRGPGLDPNTVAEYLDNTLSDDRVPDFEKVCLDSNEELAEVAACHQILTLVLGEPAEIDPAARQWMYQLPDVAAARINEPTTAPAAPQLAQGQAGVGDGKSAGQSATISPRPRATVPDYLRDPPRKRPMLQFAVAVSLVICISAVLLMALGQFEPDSPLGRLLGVRRPASEVAENSKVAENTAPTAPANAEPSTAGEQPASKEPTAAMPSQPSVDKPAATPAAEAAASIPGKPDQNPLREGQSAPGGGTLTATATVASLPAEPERKPAGEADSQPAAEPIATPSVPAAASPAPAEGVPALPSEISVAPGKESPPSTAEKGAAPAATAAAEVQAAPIGRLSSEKQVLLRFEGKQDHWQRVPSQGIIASGEQLLALPTYRPVVALTSGAMVQLPGGTRVETMAPDAAGIPGLRIDYGRILIRPAGKADVRLRLQVGTGSGVIAFGDAMSAAAVEVLPSHDPGLNPETEPWSRIVRIYGETGQVIWEEEGGAASVRIVAGSALDAFAKPARDPSPQELPKWLASEALNPLDALASPVLEQIIVIDANRPAEQTLAGLTPHRRREVRRLAVQCIGYLGEFNAAAAALNDAEYRLDWPEYIDKMAEAATRDSKTAAAVNAALQRQYGQEGVALFRMLWGYTEKGLRDGEADTLVEQLDHRTLAFRVLSAWNLEHLTGGWTLGYRPYDPPAKRQLPTQKWRQRLKSGELLARVAADHHEGDRGAAKPSVPAPAGP